jgi:glycosyltransferase involved in cell wall biosynthesis
MLTIVVFSFNRAEFLRHCVNSIERCAAGFPVLIVDDNSNDADTIKVLEELRLRHRVLQPQKQHDGLRSKHGGLYGNMQLALDYLHDDDLMCTLQDDMQFVRKFSAEEAASLQRWFAGDTRRAFVHHAFLKGSERQRSQIAFNDAEEVYYNRRENSSAGAWYSDIFIASVATLRKSDWNFRSREALNELQARQLFEPMAHWRDPFVVWLPAATSWRGKRRTLALRLGEKKHHCGFYPLQEMDAVTELAFKTRDHNVLPYAEDFLNIRKDPGVASVPAEPWIYHPLQGSRWLKWLNSLELKLFAGRS